MTTTVMSFGAGVQSTTILVAACLDFIPRPDFWVFSDPGAETQDTMTHLERCKAFLARHGMELHHLKPGDISKEAIFDGDLKTRWANVPLYVGDAGMLPRQCTTEYKIHPIEQFIRTRVLGLKKRQRFPKSAAVESWLGISADEERRATPPGVWATKEVTVGSDIFGNLVTEKQKVWKPDKWLCKVFPLMGFKIGADRKKEADDRFSFFDGWDRQDCLDFLGENWPAPVPRSACFMCPYRSNAEWREMRDKNPEEWAKAVQWDYDVRHSFKEGYRSRAKLFSGDVYVHSQRVPLDQADLDEKTPLRRGCGSLFDQEPDGICGV